MNKVLIFFLFIYLGLIPCCLKSQNHDSFSGISHQNKTPVYLNQGDIFGTRAYIENKGQFDKCINGSEKVFFAVENGNERIYFTSKGLVYKLIKEYPISEEQKEQFERGKKIEPKKPEVYFVKMDWQGANKNCVPVESEKQSHYITYGEAKYNSYGFKKITYQNIYNHIDIEFVIPEEKQFGIKYNVILHPGANAKDIKLLYQGDVRKIKKLDNGDILIKTPLEDITEHAPNSFYQGGQQLASSFTLKDDLIGFDFPIGADPQKTIIIDPWVTTVTTITSNNSAYDVDYDDLGNLYIYGGLGNAGKIAKYNSLGSLVWTFSGVVTTISWSTVGGISNFVVMKSTGKCYTGQGFNTSGATIIRLDVNGNYDNYISSALTSWNEVWDMAYHCSTGNVYGMGGSTASSQSAGILNPLTGGITPIAFFNYSPTGTNIDVACHAIDDAGEFFWIYASNATPSITNKIARINSAFTSSVWIVSSGYSTLTEYANKSAYLPSATSSNGFNCLAVNGNYLFYYDGLNLAAYNKTTGAPVASTVIAGQTVRRQAGIAVDDCNNLYLGGIGTILGYNFNGSVFSPIANIPLTTTVTNQYVYDIRLNKLNKLLYVSGSEFAGVYTAANSMACCTSSIVCFFSPPALSTSNTSITCASLGSATLNPIGGPGPYSYTWIPSGQTGSVATGLGPGTHSVVVYDGGCNLTFTATTLILPVVPFTGTVSSLLPCNGLNTGTAAINNLAGGSGNQHYLWTNGITSQTTAIATGLGPGTWTFTVTDALTSCVITDTFVLIAPTPLTLNIVQSGTASCASSSISLLANTYGGTSGYTYSWTNGPASPLYQATQPAGGTHIYTLNVLDANNCLITGTVSVNYISTPSLSVSNVSICPFAIGTLTVSGAPNYLWNNTVAGSTFTDNPLSTSVYTVTGIGPQCSSSATVAIILKPVPVATLSSNSPVCNGKALQLSGSGGNTYFWNGPAAFLSSQQNPTINPAGIAQSGNYQLTVTAVNGCTASTSGSVLVNPSPPLISSGSTVCVNQTMNLTANSSIGASYLWAGPNSFTSNLQNPAIVNPAENRSGSYSISVTDLAGCTSSAIVNVTVTALPIPSSQNSGPVCEGTVISFSANGGLNYTWNGPNAFSGISQFPIINAVGPAATGIYTVFITTGPCQVTSTTSVLIYPLPAPVASNSGPVCELRSLSLSVTAPINNTIVSYNWQGPQSFTANAASSSLNPSHVIQSGLYTVTVKDNHGCVATSTTGVTILNNPVVTATGATVCLNNSALLLAGGASSYVWSGPFFNAAGSTATIISAGKNTVGQYTVIGKAANSCTAMAFARIDTLSLPKPYLSVSPKPNVCLNEALQLEGFGGNAYDWDGPIRFNWAGKVLSFTASSMSYAGDYTLAVTDANGCRGFTYTTIVIYDLPNGSLSGTHMQACVPFCSAFKFYSATSSFSNTSAIWDLDKTVAQGDTFSHCFYIPGNYVITGHLIDTIHHCPNTATFVVNAYPNPIANFTYTPVKPIEGSDEVIFTNTSEGANLTGFSWFYQDESLYNSNTQNISHLFRDAGKYPVAMIVKNTWGCIDTITKSIEVLAGFNLYVPNVFTPNGDDNNDIFLPIGRGIKTYNLIVFDRWGEKLFESNELQTGWNGIYKAQACKSDVYIWKASISGFNGEYKELNGHVTLYR